MDSSLPHAAPSVVENFASEFLRRFDFPIPTGLAHWALGTKQIEDLWRTARGTQAPDVFSSLLAAMDVSVDACGEDLKRIPSKGPLVVVANHPHGLLDGVVIAALLSRVRSDFRILANSILAAVPELRPYVLPVDPFGSRQTIASNASILLAASRHLRSGGSLIVFPAGEVSSLQSGLQGVADKRWNPAAIEIAARAGAAVTPVFLAGRNGGAFQAAGLLHPALRTVLLGRELINKRSRRIEIHVGSPLSAATLRERESDEAAQYVRSRVYALGQRTAVTAVRSDSLPAPIAAAVDPELLAEEVSALPEDSMLFERGEWAVHVAQASSIPICLREIGRLREISFRAVGEGTRRPLDLDRFDQHYRHLFLWNRRTGQVAGAYRVGHLSEVLAAKGPTGIYTSTLFQYQPGFLRGISNGLELGRSFVRPEYQRHPHALLYLWKGIGAILAADRTLRYVLGPVSVSAEYSSASRELIISYIEWHSHRADGQRLKAHAPPRRWLRSPMTGLAKQLRSLDELSDCVADLERDHKGLPVLLRHYLNLGANVLGFNLDREFSNALDALVLLDLDSSNRPMLSKRTGLELNAR